MTGHLEELFLALIHLLKRWFVGPEHTSQMVPVRVRFRGALYQRQIQPSAAMQTRNDAFPSGEGGVRFSAAPPPNIDRGEFGPFSPFLQRDDL